MSEPSFAGKTAVITGAASGIGRATALAFARAGANIVAADVNEAGLAEVEAEVAALGGQALGVRCDVSSDHDVDGLAARAVKRFGQVDILMNNAAVMLRGHVETITMDEWQWIFGINFFGPVRGLRAFLPAMIARGDGYIVNTASVGGLWGGRAHSATYGASKFALVGLSETLYMYLKPKGIGVSVLCPGGVATNRGVNLRRISVNATDTSDLGLEDNFSPNAADPAMVANLVVQAVADRRFLILVDPRHQKLIERRASDIQAYADERIGRRSAADARAVSD